jgi:hypothetical protein
MLGIILRSLSDPAEAEAALCELGDPRILERVRADALAEGTTIGIFTARAVRHVLDHASEEIWLDLLGAMARTPKPGVVALGIILRKALTESPPLPSVPMGSQPASPEPPTSAVLP